MLIIWIEAIVIAVLAIVLLALFIFRRRRMLKYIEAITYDTSNAKNNTLQNFPMPIAVFRLEDTGIIWGNDALFDLLGDRASRLDFKLSEGVPGFSSHWLSEGKTCMTSLVEIDGKKFQIHGNVVRRRDDGDDNKSAYLGIAYFVDVTDYENTKLEYAESRPVACVIVIDNLDELYKNQPDRVRNDIIEEVGDKLSSWAADFNAILRRYDRDRFVAVFEKRNLTSMRESRFRVIESVHEIENPAGIAATISLGFGDEAQSLSESLQFADMANELALTRGGDQAVVKNRLNFEFFGGRGPETEKRTKVRSRVMANTLAELIKDSSRVFVMGHRNADFDSLGAAVGICCLARKLGVQSKIIIDENTCAADTLLARMKEEEEYRLAFISAQDGIIKADGRTLLIIVDTNRVDQLEDEDIIAACNKIAVIDHHRVSTGYIQNAALGFIEPYSSSSSELVSEILEEFTEKNDIMKCEAEALLSGIVLDTKNFTIRTGERTFDAAGFLRRAGADTTDVKRLLQSNLEDTISKYAILQNAELYRNVAVAVPTESRTKVVAAKAADELLNIIGVDASIVIFPGSDGRIYASARSIGELNVQIIMEKLGGGGNRSAAAVQFEPGVSLEQAVELTYRAIDEYLG